MTRRITRNLLKTLTYRAAGSAFAFGAAWIISGDVKLSLGVLTVDGIGKTLLYYCHECIWDRIGSAHSN